jgi:CRP/FNR family transcriptional regulator, cyclic AMP receptor protein
MQPNSIMQKVEGGYKAETLPDHPLFDGLSAHHRRILAQCSMRAKFRTGEMIVETGDRTDCFYLVISGSIGLLSLDERVPRQTETILAGGILGWSWLFPPSCWHFDAVALEETEVIYFNASRLCEGCDGDHGLGYELFRRMAQRHTLGKSTLVTGESPDTEFPPDGDGEDGERPLSSVVRGNLSATAYTADPVHLFHCAGLPPMTSFAGAAVDFARTAMKVFVNGWNSLFTGTESGLVPEAGPEQV